MQLTNVTKSYSFRFMRKIIIAIDGYSACGKSTTAKALAKQKVDIFRSGIWKPRTRPNSFEGVGTEGLKWLRRVKEETGLEALEIISF